MDSTLLLISGLFGARVRCVKPAFDWSDTNEYPDPQFYPLPGDLGRVTGILDGEQTCPLSGLVVRVQMDDQGEDPDYFTIDKFRDCFSVDNSKRKFRSVLG